MEGQSETIRPPRRQWRRGDHERRDTRRPSEPTLKTEVRGDKGDGATRRRGDKKFLSPCRPVAPSPRPYGEFYCLIFSQSLRKLARPMSVSGCLSNCSITLNGMVAMSAPSRADSITCSVWRMLAARIWVLNP